MLNPNKQPHHRYAPNPLLGLHNTGTRPCGAHKQQLDLASAPPQPDRARPHGPEPPQRCATAHGPRRRPRPPHPSGQETQRGLPHSRGCVRGRATPLPSGRPPPRAAHSAWARTYRPPPRQFRRNATRNEGAGLGTAPLGPRHVPGSAAPREK